MIIDKISNTSLYKLNERFQKGFNYIKNTDFSTKPIGEEIIDNENVYAIIMEYQTTSHLEIESHEIYADIQFIIEGEEIIKVKIKDGSEKKISEYNIEEDFGTYETETSSLLLKKDMFAIFFPDDLHSPSMIVNNKAKKVKKVVVKVKLHP